jgi:2-oxoisovalerate dehydrogenase E2 component (dihydrolipoyl transacylase)
MSTPPTAAEGSVAVFCLPDLGEGLTDAEIVAWLVEEGAAIEEEQPFVRVSTAKAEVEIPSPYRGVVVACHGEAGEVLPVGV